MAGVIVCGVLGGIVPAFAKVHDGVWRWGPLASVLQPVVSSPHLIENINILDSAKHKDCRLPFFDRSNLCSAKGLFHRPAGGDAPTWGNGAFVEILKIARSGHLSMVFQQSVFHFGPVDYLSARCGPRVFYGDRADHFGFVVRLIAYANYCNIWEQIGPQFTPRSFASFDKGPQQQDGPNDSRPKRDYREPQIEAGHTVSLSDLLDRSPLGAQVGIFLAIRIIAVGLIALGYRLTSHRIFEARMTGGLVVVVGLALLAGVVELVGYS
jgi:hypothetical protein